MTYPNPEIVRTLEAELFTPALQQAFARAKEDGHAKQDALYAAANAYQNMLVPMLGDGETAVVFLQQQLDFLRSQTNAQ